MTAKRKPKGRTPTKRRRAPRRKVIGLTKAMQVQAGWSPGTLALIKLGRGIGLVLLIIVTAVIVTPLTLIGRKMQD